MKASHSLTPFVVIILAIAASTWWLHAAPPSATSQPAGSAAGTGSAGTTPPAHYPVVILPGPSTPTVLTNALNHGGEPVTVACSTCHTTRPPNVARHASAELTEFHQGLAYRHGDLSCLSCHNATNYDTLRKADSTALSYPNVIELCGQCHGPQLRSYKAGAHGGMTGYWDRSRGPRERNNCVNCHDPHAPAYPRVKPVFAPVDRGARQQEERANAHHEQEEHHD